MGRPPVRLTCGVARPLRLTGWLGRNWITRSASRGCLAGTWSFASPHELARLDLVVRSASQGCSAGTWSPAPSCKVVRKGSQGCLAGTWSALSRKVAPQGRDRPLRLARLFCDLVVRFRRVSLGFLWAPRPGLPNTNVGNTNVANFFYKSS